MPLIPLMPRYDIIWYHLTKSQKHHWVSDSPTWIQEILAHLEIKHLILKHNPTSLNVPFMSWKVLLCFEAWQCYWLINSDQHYMHEKLEKIHIMKFNSIQLWFSADSSIPVSRKTCKNRFNSIQLVVVAGLIDSDQRKPYDTTKRLWTPQHAKILFSWTILMIFLFHFTKLSRA